MSEVLLCFCLYYSTVVYAVFLGNFHREVYKIPRAMLYMIPAAPAFYLIYTWSRTIPDAVAGMLVKTILSRITFSLALCKGMNRPFLITFLETYLVMPVIAFTEILLSSVVDLSAFTGPLSDQTSVIGNSIIQLAASTVEILLAWPVSSALRNVLEKRVIPFRYTLLAFTSLVTVSVQGALFFFLNVSDKPIPSLVLAGLAFISLITLCGSLYLMFNEAVARKSASRLPFRFLLSQIPIIGKLVYHGLHFFRCLKRPAQPHDVPPADFRKPCPLDGFQNILAVLYPCIRPQERECRPHMLDEIPSDADGILHDPAAYNERVSDIKEVTRDRCPCPAQKCRDPGCVPHDLSRPVSDSGILGLQLRFQFL